MTRFDAPDSALRAQEGVREGLEKLSTYFTTMVTGLANLMVVAGGLYFLDPLRRYFWSNPRRSSV